MKVDVCMYINVDQLLLASLQENIWNMYNQADFNLWMLVSSQVYRAQDVIKIILLAKHPVIDYIH